MKKLWEKDEVWFAVFWIVVYVLGFSLADGLSERMGVPKLLTCLFGLGLSLVLLRWVKKQGLWDDYGLCAFRGKAREFLYFIPLILISSVNLWCGVTMRLSLPLTLLYILSMCFVGFLEELIFRGFLFRGMCRSGVKMAILVSSLTFGIGHIVNLLNGAPVYETLLQLVYASAIGFCYTILFYKGGSLVPCILSHAVVNSLSVFAVEPGQAAQLLIALMQTVLGVGYGLWLLRKRT